MLFEFHDQSMNETFQKKFWENILRELDQKLNFDSAGKSVKLKQKNLLPDNFELNSKKT